MIQHGAERQTALVTGASSGIGRDLAREFARDSHDLVLVARNVAALESLASELTRAYGIDARVVVADLAQPGAARRVFDEVRRAAATVDVLVNNAGFGLQGRFAEHSPERITEMIQVNVTAVTELTRMFLPDMLARNRGGLLNVASTAAFQPGPFMAVYYATKAYVLSLTEAIAEELSGTALRVSCLAPGPTASGFAEAAHMSDTALFKRVGTMTSADVARIGYAGWKRGKTIVIPGTTNRLGASLVRVSPRGVVRKVIRTLNT
jgi:short-subunit dehydrogenase